MQTSANEKLSDEKLIELLCSRNVRAVEFLYDKYACMLFGVIYRIVNDEKRAEGILFKTFTHAWNHYNHFDSTKQSISIWMMSIARQIALESISLPERAKAESQLLNELKESGVKEKMSVLELVFFRGLSVNKIAEGLDCTASDVKALLKQATNELNNEYLSR